MSEMPELPSDDELAELIGLSLQDAKLLEIDEVERAENVEVERLRRDVAALTGVTPVPESVPNELLMQHAVGGLAQVVASLQADQRQHGQQLGTLTEVVAKLVDMLAETSRRQQEQAEQLGALTESVVDLTAKLAELNRRPKGVFFAEVKRR
jgi:hypothetical protein